MTQLQIYNLLYSTYKSNCIHLSTDQASRKANLYAVKHTWNVFTKRKRLLENLSQILLTSKDKQCKP